MVISFDSYFEDPHNAYSILVKGVYWSFPANGSSPNYLPTYLPTYLNLGFQPTTSSSGRGCPTAWAIFTSQQGGLIMGSTFYSRDTHHEDCSATIRGVCECKASIKPVKYTFKEPTALAIKVFFPWNLSLSEQENFSTLNMSLSHII